MKREVVLFHAFKIMVLMPLEFWMLPSFSSCVLGFFPLYLFSFFILFNPSHPNQASAYNHFSQIYLVCNSEGDKSI